MFSKSSFGRLAAGFLVAGFVALLGHVFVSNADPISEKPADAATDSANAITPDGSQNAPNKYYAVVLRTGPGFVEGGGAQPGMAEHVKFIKAAHAAGVVPLAGLLFADDEGTQVYGLLYFVRAENLLKARGVVMNEPFVHEDIVKISSIRMFTPGVGGFD